MHRTWLDPVGQRQGADRHAAAGDGPSPRAWRPLRRRPTTSWPPAKASRPCCRCAACCRPCRWSRRSRPIISPPSCSRQTLRRLYIARDRDPAGDARDGSADRAGRTRPGSRRSRCRRRSATSTRICATRHRRSSGSVCASSSPRRTSSRFMALATRRDGMRPGTADRSRSRRSADALRVGEAAPTAFRGRSAGKRPGPATAGRDYFPPPADGRALHRETK